MASAPLLLHVDINRTIVLSDSLNHKTIEELIRENVADLFWGAALGEGENTTWQWIRSSPSAIPPVGIYLAEGASLMTFADYCKRLYKDKKQYLEATRYFLPVKGQFVEKEMEKVMHAALAKLKLPAEVCHTQAARDAGLAGTNHFIFESLFNVVTKLQRTKRQFAVLFRSFGIDHGKIEKEWNAFCEGRHPVCKHLLDDIGPMDGSVPGVPDRRIKKTHTLYRDSQGPLLIIDVCTNGPTEGAWDKWARTRPRPTEDTREGRKFVQEMGAKSIAGIDGVRQWLLGQVQQQCTAAVKDDWAWWHHHSNSAESGKFFPLMENVQQLFFDDNIDADNMIVDCRDEHGNNILDSTVLGRCCVKVNAVEAILDDDYFFRRVQSTALDIRLDHLDIGSSFKAIHKDLEKVQEANASLQKQLAVVQLEKQKLLEQLGNLRIQITHLTDANRAMRMSNRLNVRDEGELHTLLANDVDLTRFGSDGFMRLSDLWQELHEGRCWLESQQGKIVRVVNKLCLKMIYKDLILIESNRQDSESNIETTNYIPSEIVNVKDESLQDALGRWLECGLSVDLRNVVELQQLPVFVPDAPERENSSTRAYPIPCILQHCEGTIAIPEEGGDGHAELLTKFGLPSGKQFSIVTSDVHGKTMTRFFRWERKETWQQSLAFGRSFSRAGPKNVAAICQKLFHKHPRADVYQRLLLEMFSTFDAQKLMGGFSGSVVVRVQPFERSGAPGQPCIVKLDAGDVIREEFVNSAKVFKALPSRAAQILGDAVYAQGADGKEFGAMRLEFAGACWNISELAQGSSSPLSTYKDLLLYEGEQMHCCSDLQDDTRPLGNVSSVLAETFGPGGIISSLRQGGEGLARAANQPLTSGWYTLKGKESRYNLYSAKKGEYPPDAAMRELYREHFGAQMPDLKELVVGNIKPRLEALAQKYPIELSPMIALAHGDLNAANIMIDSMDAVWLIDFATSVEMPLFTDMCKFEMATLFEYTIMPITPKLLMEFASSRKSCWEDLRVGDWFRVDHPIIEMLLQDLFALSQHDLDYLTESDLTDIIKSVAARSGKAPRKQRAIMQRLRSRLTMNPAQLAACFAYCKSISKAFLQGNTLAESLRIRVVPPCEGDGAEGTSSLRASVGQCISIRRFMEKDIGDVFRRRSQSGDDIQPVDTLSVQLWLPLLRETYRLIGYANIAPPFKVWCIHHCELVAHTMMEMLDLMENVLDGKVLFGGDLVWASAQEDDDAQDKGQVYDPSIEIKNKRVASLTQWAYDNASALPARTDACGVVRRVHDVCPIYREEPGIFAPLLDVTTADGSPVRVIFDDEKPDDASQVFDILFLAAVGSSAGEGQPAEFSEFEEVPIGWMVPDDDGLTEGGVVVHFFSRLLPLSQEFFERHKKSKGVLSANTYHAHAWLSGSGLEQAFEESNTNALRSKRMSVGRRSSALFARNAEASLADLELQIFSVLEASALPRGNNAGSVCRRDLQLLVGEPCCCYPAGSWLCISKDSDVHGNMVSHLAPAVVVIKLWASGQFYMVARTQMNGNEKERLTPRGHHVDLDESELFPCDPIPSNHRFIVPVNYCIGQRILFMPEALDGGATSWAAAQVQMLPSKSKPAYGLRVLGKDGKHSPDLNGGGAAELSAYLHNMNSAAMEHNLLSSTSYEEQIRTIKSFYRARNGFIIDSITGACLSIMDCATPTLQVERGPAQGKNVWQTMLNVLENRNNAWQTCEQQAYIVLGPPGSGKSSMVCRLVIEILDRYDHLVPLVVPGADLLKRSTENWPDPGDTAAVEAWFDKYLMLTYGEDSLRYTAIRQAMKLRATVFLFDGLEDAAALTPVVEKLVMILMARGEMIVVTTRLTPDNLLAHQELPIALLRLRHLTDDQKRTIAKTRLGSAEFEAFDELVDRLHKNQLEANGEETEGQDVFGNPLMLSMLLGYLKTTTKKEVGEQANFTIAAVYHFASEVMLQRIQSRSQADRHIMPEKVELSKVILRKIAMAMQLQRKEGIRLQEIPGLFKDDKELRANWDAMAKRVLQGEAMFLRVSGSAGAEEIRFLVRGFQDFFVASFISQFGDHELPSLKPLLTDQWWAQALEMLSEAWPHSYVKLVQDRVASEPGDEGETFMHMAAAAGHRPLFQLMPLFSKTNRAVLQQTDKEGRTPLHAAAAKGYAQMCRMMLDNGAEVAAEDHRGRLAVHHALCNGHFSTAQFLTERGRDHVAHKDCSGAENRLETLASQALAGMTEEEFLAAALETYTELHIFGPAESVDRQRTIGALLAVFWVASDRYEDFVRCQKPEVRLTRASWERLREWTRRAVGLADSVSTLNSMLVCVALSNLGKVKPFRSIFAPGLDDHMEALAVILRDEPALTPSYAKMIAHDQHLILSCLKADFNFGQFLQAENIPGSFSALKEALDGKEATDMIGFILFRSFAMMCGILGMKTVEGSLFMTESNYLKFEEGLTVLEHLPRDGALKIYDRFLAVRAAKHGLDFVDTDPESRALVRLACLARVSDAKGVAEVSKAFQELKPKLRQSLVGFLNSDGVKRTPGFLLYNSPLFLETARSNEKIGLGLAVELLLKVYEASAHAYAGSDEKVVTIMLDELVSYTKTCKCKDKFEFTKFEISRAAKKGHLKGILNISQWQLQTDAEVLDELSEKVGSFCDGLAPDTGLQEHNFLKLLPTMYPELRFMNGDDTTSTILQETTNAMLVVFWTAADHPDAFTRGQEQGDKLTRQSWAELRDVLNDAVADSEVMDVLLVVLLVRGVFRLPKFRAQVASDAKTSEQALAHVFKTCPQVLPSFWRLTESCRCLARWCLLNDFDIVKFTSAEAIPANISALRDLLICGGSMFHEPLLQRQQHEQQQQKRSVELCTDSFFAHNRNEEERDESRKNDIKVVLLYMTLAEAGLANGVHSSDGCSYMTETKWQEFSLCVRAMQRLHKGENGVYDEILDRTAGMVGIDFNSTSEESRALARLATLCLEDPERASSIVDAFGKVEAMERVQLSKYLAADGLRHRPGFVLRHSRTFFRNAVSNSNVGAVQAIRVLLKVCDAMSQECDDRDRAVITVDFDRLATFAKEFRGNVTFDEVPFELASAMVMPMIWIPSRDQKLVEALRTRYEELARVDKAGSITEVGFKSRFKKALHELGYFGPADKRRDMLAAFRLLSDFREDLDVEDIFAQRSYERMRSCVADCVSISTEEIVDATLVLMVMHAFGKVRLIGDEPTVLRKRALIPYAAADAMVESVRSGDGFNVGVERRANHPMPPKERPSPSGASGASPLGARSPLLPASSPAPQEQLPPSTASTTHVGTLPNATPPLPSLAHQHSAGRGRPVPHGIVAPPLPQAPSPSAEAVLPSVTKPRPLCR